MIKEENGDFLNDFVLNFVHHADENGSKLWKTVSKGALSPLTIIALIN